MHADCHASILAIRLIYRYELKSIESSSFWVVVEAPYDSLAVSELLSRVGEGGAMFPVYCTDSDSRFGDSRRAHEATDLHLTSTLRRVTAQDGLVAISSSVPHALRTVGRYPTRCAVSHSDAYGSAWCAPRSGADAPKVTDMLRTM